MCARRNSLSLSLCCWPATSRVAFTCLPRSTIKNHLTLWSLTGKTCTVSKRALRSLLSTPSIMRRHRSVWLSWAMNTGTFESFPSPSSWRKNKFIPSSPRKLRRKTPTEYKTTTTREFLKALQQILMTSQETTTQTSSLLQTSSKKYRSKPTMKKSITSLWLMSLKNPCCWVQVQIDWWKCGTTLGSPEGH